MTDAKNAYDANKVALSSQSASTFVSSNDGQFVGIDSENDFYPSSLCFYFLYP